MNLMGNIKNSYRTKGDLEQLLTLHLKIKK